MATLARDAARSTPNTMTCPISSWRMGSTSSSTPTCHGIVRRQDWIGAAAAPARDQGAGAAGARHLPAYHRKAFRYLSLTFTRKLSSGQKPASEDSPIRSASRTRSAARLTGVGDVLSGGSFSEGYDRFRAKAKAIDQSLEEKYPGETIGGAVLGGIATGAPAINLLTVPAKVAKAAPIAERIVGAAARTGARATNAAATGGAYGAGAGFASGEGLQDRLAGGFWGGASGAALGAGLGVAVPAVAEALGWLAGKAKTPFRGIGDQGRYREQLGGWPRRKRSMRAVQSRRLRDWRRPDRPAFR